MICGAETWEQMIRFGKSKETFLKTFLELPNGIPSKDTINRTFSVIDSERFESCFVDWVNSIADLKKGQIIAIDGKTIRGANYLFTWSGQNHTFFWQILFIIT